MISNSPESRQVELNKTLYLECKDKYLISAFTVFFFMFFNNNIIIKLRGADPLPSGPWLHHKPMETAGRKIRDADKDNVGKNAGGKKTFQIWYLNYLQSYMCSLDNLLHIHVQWTRISVHLAMTRFW